MPRVIRTFALALAALAFPAAAAAAPEVISEKPYYLSVHAPEGEARGTVMTMHGGGWKGDLGARADRKLARWIEGLTEQGYRVANLAYRSGSASMSDALAAFDVVHRTFGDQPICLWGQSAGAHLSLMVASRRGSDVACVVDIAGPSNLRNWGVGNLHGRRLATNAFGAWRLRRLSPVRRVGAIQAPVLVAAATCDRMIGYRQQRRFVQRLRGSGSPASLHTFRPGGFTHVPHCDVSRRTFDRFLAEQARFLAARM